jgi:DNA-binding HxlR family transcriptional regulator
MGKHNKTGRSKNPDGQYVLLNYYLLRSDAWRGLSGNAMRVYFELHMRFNGTNNGQLFIGMDRISSVLGISKSTVCKAFKELVEKGWIVKVKDGKWIRGQASEWRLTTKSTKSIPATNEWKQWRKPAEAIKKRNPYGSTKQKHFDYISAKNEFVGTEIEPS